MTERSKDILIIDDEADIRALIQGILEDEGYTIRTASNAAQAREKVAEQCPDLMILDIWLQGSDQDGVELLELFKNQHPNLPIIMISGHGTIETAVSSIKLGAYDFIEKPFKSDRLILMIRRALETAELRQENSVLKELAARTSEFSLSGTSPAIQAVRQMIERVSATNSRILITGEPGTGKEIVARIIHRNSERGKAPFLVVNCANLQPDTLEVELFGREATEDQPAVTGLLERANGATLFFDEVSDMPLETQGKLVRVIQEQNFHRVGGTAPVSVDVRILASSNRDLVKLVEHGGFRKDLYYRLNVVPIEMPCLRERLQDLPELVQNISEELCAQSGMASKTFTPDLLGVMQTYDWPGNIRQLKNAIEWILIMSGPDCHTIGMAYLPPDLQTLRPAASSGVTKKSSLNGAANSNANERGAGQGDEIGARETFFPSDLLTKPLREAREFFERHYLLAQIKRFEGNVSQTAKFVGMERSALHRKLKLLQVNTNGDPDAGEDAPRASSNQQEAG